MTEILSDMAAAGGMEQSSNLLSKVLQHATDPAAVSTSVACNDLNAFTNQVSASNKLSPAQKSELLTLASHIGATLGCP